jgi:hypothetical protein
VFLLSLFLYFIYKNYRKIFYLLMLSYLAVNLNKFKNLNINRSGYVERKAIVAEIARDAGVHNYPCISISYITKPGFNFGYRYLFYNEGLHVNNPVSGSPIYTIVFPLSIVDKFDNNFGALGLIYPDYEKYNIDDVYKSCSGANSNLTDPMFGFTN